MHYHHSLDWSVDQNKYDSAHWHLTDAVIISQPALTNICTVTPLEPLFTTEAVCIMCQNLRCKLWSLRSSSSIRMDPCRDWSIPHLSQMSWSLQMVNPMRESPWSKPRGEHHVSLTDASWSYEFFNVWLSPPVCNTFSFFYQYFIS